MTTVPKVSVVMAVYNSARHVIQAINSILAQSLEDFEFIIVDDGSTDETTQILRALDDKRIILLNNEENVGLAISLNRGIGMSNGQYIARQDADDISHPDRLLQEVRYLDDHTDIGVVGTASQWIDDDGNSFKVWPFGNSNEELQSLLLQYCPLIHGSTMYRRQCFEEVGGYDDSMRTAQDYDFWLRISESWDLVCLPEELYQFRWHLEKTSIKHENEQSRNADISLTRALQRRKEYAKLAICSNLPSYPHRLRTMSRRQLAQRYIWWSAGVRAMSKGVAFRWLMFALLFDPTSPDIWAYVRGIIVRKLRF